MLKEDGFVLHNGEDEMSTVDGPGEIQKSMVTMTCKYLYHRTNDIVRDWHSGVTRVPDLGVDFNHAQRFSVMLLARNNLFAYS